MRDYGKVSPQFWVGKTGRQLRGDMPAQLVALYLMTSPHANMIGVYYCPIEYIAKETGLSIEGASEALLRLIQADFCTFDADNEWVFVHKFAESQIGEDLKPADKRVQGVVNELAKIPKGQCWQGFRARYAVPYNLPSLVSPIEAPSESPASQKQKQKQKQNTCPPDGGRFDTFWQAYPKKEAKKDAETVFAKLNPDADLLAKMLAFLAAKRNTDDWAKEGGKFVPLPATWLRAERWNDEIPLLAIEREAFV